MKTIEGEHAEIEAALQAVRFRSEATGWTVALFEKDGGHDVFTAVGTLPEIGAGERVKLSGVWTMDRRYGPQLKIESFEVLKPKTLEAMVRFIVKLEVPGIGKATAALIVARFGMAALDIAEDEPDRVAPLKNMTGDKAKLLSEEIRKRARLKDLMIYLEKHGLGGRFAQRVHDRYSGNAIEKIEEDPYRLARDIWGVGFHRADQVASSLGIEGEDPRRLRAGILHVLSEAAVQGDCFLPLDDAVARAQKIMEGVGRSKLTDAIDDGVRAKLLVDEEGRIYAAHQHAREIRTARRLRKSLMAIHEVTVSERAANETLLAQLEKERGLVLAKEQRDAVTAAAENGVVVITGGPGTGKTTVTRFVLDVLERLGVSLALCSPTGRAARRLQEATAREASTIHRLLGYRGDTGNFGFNAENPLPYGAILVDEVSMVDLWLFDCLLAAIKPGTRLILVGDANQLPSVGPGEVLRDLVRSGMVPTVRLQHIFRQSERSAIVVNAHRILHAQDPVCDDDFSAKDEFIMIEREEPPAIAREIVRVVSEHLPQQLGVSHDKIQVLAPMYKGDTGVDVLNDELQKCLNPQTGHKGERQYGKRTFRDGDRVLQLRNDYSLEIMNGEMGDVEEAGKGADGMRVKFDRIVTIPRDGLDQVALAYAITVHKSQGSEYDWVVIPLTTQHAIMLNRPILYTAVTRARKGVVLVGTRRALSMALKSRGNRQRYTTLADRLKEKEVVKT